MKWQHGLAILVFILLSFLLWERSMKNQLINQLQTQSLTREVDTLTKETEVKVIEWKEKKVFADKIVNKWHNVHDTIIKRDTLLIECQKDIFNMDTAIKKCDTALNVCLQLNEAQKDLNKILEKQNKNQKKAGILKVIGAIGVGILIENARKKVD
jgi:hypothetical protein